MRSKIRWYNGQVPAVDSLDGRLLRNWYKYAGARPRTVNDIVVVSRGSAPFFIYVDHSKCLGASC